MLAYRYANEGQGVRISELTCLISRERECDVPLNDKDCWHAFRKFFTFSELLIVRLPLLAAPYHKGPLHNSLWFRNPAMTSNVEEMIVGRKVLQSKTPPMESGNKYV